MKKEEKKQQRDEIQRILPVFIEWRANPKHKPQLFLADGRKFFKAFVSDESRAMGWPDDFVGASVEAFSVSIEITKPPSIGKINKDRLPVSLSYSIMTSHGICGGTKKNFVFDKNDDFQVIHGLTKKTAQAILWEAERVYIRRITNHDNNTMIVENKPIQKTMESYNYSASWRMMAWFFWHTFSQKGYTCKNRVDFLNNMAKCGFAKVGGDNIALEVTEDALRSAAKEMGLPMGEN